MRESLRLGEDSLYYVYCSECGYFVAYGPQEFNCPHYRGEPFNGSHWGNGKLPADWVPEFGAAWLEKEEVESPAVCNCPLEILMSCGCRCGGR